MPTSRTRRIFAFVAVCLVTAAPAAAQTPSAAAPSAIAKVAADSVVSADTFVEHEGAEGGAVFDFLGGWRLGPSVELIARPVLWRDHDGDWDGDIYQLALRHDRPGRVRMRLEGGYLPSPIGISPLESRADANPLIAPITAYTAALPVFEAGTPQTQLASPLYPLAVQATWATSHWDVRAALLESSLVRVRPLTGDNKPPRAPQLAVGGGLTPYIGLRLGASLAYGRYARAEEVADPSAGDRTATIVGVDGDYSIGYTRVYGDFVRTSLERAGDHAVATGLTITAVRTLSPRWYVAGRGQRLTTNHLLVRQEHSYSHHTSSDSSYGDHSGDYGLQPPASNSPYGTAPYVPVADWVDGGSGFAFGLESTLGYRLSPDITVRAGYLGYRAFGDDELEHHATFSLVWAKRWK